ncbi:hypothetical protein ACFLUJ_06945 [Chloroflexota bacterium]
MPKKKPEYIRMYLGGGLPETRKERDKLYRLLERTNTMQMIMSGSEILVRKGWRVKGKTT